jgi:hypothetical protein
VTFLTIHWYEIIPRTIEGTPCRSSEMLLTKFEYLPVLFSER